MKVILTQDVAKIGRRFDVVNVPDGYALNRLIPKGLAKPGTPENIKSVEAQKARTAEGRQAEGETFKTAAEEAKNITLNLEVSTNKQGHMFEALKPEAVAKAYGEQGINLAAANIHIASPIKEVGEHEIELISGDDKIVVNISLVSA